MQINVEHANQLIAHLEGLLATGKEHKFNMKRWLTHPVSDDDYSYIGHLAFDLELAEINEAISPIECRTVACLAGHAALIGGCPRGRCIKDFATEWLGLKPAMAHHLFLGRWSRRVDLIENITLREAIDQLKMMVKKATELENEEYVR